MGKVRGSSWKGLACCSYAFFSSRQWEKTSDVDSEPMPFPDAAHFIHYCCL